MIRNRQTMSERPPRIGIFGLLGSGNFGNDGSLEAVLDFLRARHPDASVECLCPGPDEITTRYGIATKRANWYRAEYQTASSATALVTKAVGKIVDTFRIMSWVRRCDTIIVPGSGILESDLTVRPWDRPYALFLVCAAGRLFRSKVALISVGAGVADGLLTRWLLTTAARCAHYRSFRDAQSREAMHDRRAIRKDPVYPDLAFALPTPADAGDSQGRVGVGVMAYHGGNGDRKRAQEVYSTYVNKMKHFVRWLIDNGYPVLLFAGDNADVNAADEIIADAREYRPELDSSFVASAPAQSLTELMKQMAAVDSVVATRYHNVLCALKMAKPTVSIGYAAKNDALMSDMGLAEFCQSIRDLDVTMLIQQFTALEHRREEIRRSLTAKNVAAERLLEHQFAMVSSHLLSATEPRNAHSRSI